jgi:hypothetical protein
MKAIGLFVATLVLASPALLPGSTHAGELDDLDVTMAVIDDMANLDEALAEIEGTDIDGERDREEPGYGAARRGEAEYEDGFTREEGGFEHDEDFDDEALDAEDDFETEEGEDVDLDEYDEPARAR